MTKKDYELIAQVFNAHAVYQNDFIKYEGDSEDEQLIKDVRERLAGQMADRLAQDNPKFDRDKFLTACGIRLEQY